MGSHAFRACLIWLMTSLFYSFQFFLRSAPNALSDQLMEEFAIDASMLGVLSAAYYVPYALLQIPVGIALDVYGPKQTLRIGTIVCVAGAILFGFSTNLTLAMMGRFLIGAGAAVSFTGSIRANGLWFSHARLAFAVGLLSAVGKFGGSAANALLPVLVPIAPSWRSVVWVLCTGGALLVVLIWLFVKDGPQDRFKPLVSSLSVQELKPQLLRVARTPIVWIMGFYGYALYLNLSVFSDTYSINFLSQHLGISRKLAGSMASVVLGGSAVGASVLSYLSDVLQKRRPFLRVSAIVTLALSSLIFFGPPLEPWIMMGCLFTLGFFSGGQVLVFAVAAESVNSRLTGIAVGVTNSLLMLGGALHNPLIGFLLNICWEGHCEGGHPVYTVFNYRMAFMSMTACFILAVVLSFLMKESYPEKAVSQAA